MSADNITEQGKTSKVEQLVAEISELVEKTKEKNNDDIILQSREVCLDWYGFGLCTITCSFGISADGTWKDAGSDWPDGISVTDPHLLAEYALAARNDFLPVYSVYNQRILHLEDKYKTPYGEEFWQEFDRVFNETVLPYLHTNTLDLLSSLKSDLQIKLAEFDNPSV